MRDLEVGKIAVAWPKGGKLQEGDGIGHDP